MLYLIGSKPGDESHVLARGSHAICSIIITGFTRTGWTTSVEDATCRRCRKYAVKRNPPWPLAKPDTD